MLESALSVVRTLLDKWPADTFPAIRHQNHLSFMISLYDRTERRYEKMARAAMELERALDLTQVESDQAKQDERAAAVSAAATKFDRAMRGLFFLPRRGTFDAVKGYIELFNGQAPDGAARHKAAATIIASIGNDLHEFRKMLYKIL